MPSESQMIGRKSDSEYPLGNLSVFFWSSRITWMCKFIIIITSMKKNIPKLLNGMLKFSYNQKTDFISNLLKLWFLSRVYKKKCQWTIRIVNSYNLENFIKENFINKRDNISVCITPWFMIYFDQILRFAN